MDGVFQRGNKIQLDNVLVQNHRLELRGTNYTVRAYVSIENTGDSYNVKPMADNLELASGGTNGQWGGQVQNCPAERTERRHRPGYGHATGPRTGRPGPRGTRYARVRQPQKHDPGINNWDIGSVIAGAPETGGAWLSQQSRMYHADGQYDFASKIKFVNLLVGARRPRVRGDSRRQQLRGLLAAHRGTHPAGRQQRVLPEVRRFRAGDQNPAQRPAQAVRFAAPRLQPRVCAQS